MNRPRPIQSTPPTLEYRKTKDKAMDFMLRMALGAISLLFVGLTFAYTFGRRLSDDWVQFSLPKLFWLSTLFVLLCSYAMQQISKAYERDRTSALRRNLNLALLMGLGFLISQFFAWKTLSASGYGLSGSPSAAYVYLISWLHAAHILVGLVFIVASRHTVLRNTRDEVEALLFFSDHQRKRRLNMLTLYWHVVDGLWLYLFIFFLFFHT